MNIKFRYICGVLAILCIDVYLFIDILFPNKISINVIYVLVVPIILIGNILDKKFGYIIDKHKKIFIVLGAIMLLITFILLALYR